LDKGCPTRFWGGKTYSELVHRLFTRELALLFYRLLRYGVQYVEKGLKSYEAKVVEIGARLLRKLAKKTRLHPCPFRSELDNGS